MNMRKSTKGVAKKINDRGVTPVIGIVLVVALTVILAATVGIFVLDIGGGTQTAPSVAWEWDYNDSAGNATATLTGGESIDVSRLSGVDSTNSSPGFIVNDKDGDGRLTSNENVKFTNVSKFDTLKIVWRDKEGDTRTIIGEVTVPVE